NGSGRKTLPNKKQAVQVYLDPNLKEQIESTDIDKCTSLSQKTAYLIEKGVQSMSSTVITKPNNNLETKKNLKTSTKTVRFIDLFAGLGGTRIGFLNALRKMELEGSSVFVSEIKN